MTILTRAAKGSELTYTELDANLVDTRDALAASSGSSLVGYLPAGTGGVATTVQAKERERVSIFDFITSAEKADVVSRAGTMNVTYAFALAWAVGDIIDCPSGVYLVDNLSWVANPNGVSRGIVGVGYDSTVFKQANVANPAINMYSNATTGQIRAGKLLQCGVTGTGIAGTVASVIVGATYPYVVTGSEVDIKVKYANTAFEIVTSGGADLVYGNTFKVITEHSAKTAAKTSGAYNTYDLFLDTCADGTSLYDGSTQGIFTRVVSDGSQTYAGQNCTINLPTIETIYGTAVYAPLNLTGYNHVCIKPTITNVNQTSISGGAAICWSHRHTIIEPRIWGSVYPNYPFGLGAEGEKATIIGGDTLSYYKIEDYMTAAQLSKLTSVGDSFTYSTRQRAPVNSQNIITTATYIVDSQKSTKGLDKVIVYNNAASGTLTLPKASQTSSLTASILGSVMTVTAVGSGTIAVGDIVKFATAVPNTFISSFGTGTGGLGTYNLNQNCGSGGSITITTDNNDYMGREITVITRVAQTVVNADANVVPMAGTAATAILAATIGKWATLKYDGTYWNIIANN
jgi:hypothetical protein